MTASTQIIEATPGPAAVRTIDFSLIDDQRTPRPRKPPKFDNGHTKSTSPKQLRARARRNHQKAGESLELLHKPIEEWDDEELARGRPRAADGTFKGRSPSWISREVHENAVERFRQIVRDGMNARTVKALELLSTLMEDDSVDDKGKPNVPPSTKAEIARWLVEHVLGKPTQRTESDISVRLQGVLASATVMPGSSTLPALPGAYAMTSPRSEQDLSQDASTDFIDVDEL